ncbi:hypothetical protein D9613_007726 [Agrocybe pediades]|uniref:SET domain-containing protein n=1 Tax=Agrocybe pediades TaxID=84607 RepID=A0A8H4QN88_9AGAR|nr:hypothetical protein D9613_007726 [Agrocybe pediades]
MEFNARTDLNPIFLHIPTEYVGEIFDGEQMAALGTLQNYAGLNYAFGLTGENLSLDSWFIGNETRYLNHSREANCSATVFRIDGDLRIVLQTDEPVKAGEELYLNYGEKYWQGREPGEAD